MSHAAPTTTKPARPKAKRKPIRRSAITGLPVRDPLYKKGGLPIAKIREAVRIVLAEREREAGA